MKINPSEINLASLPWLPLNARSAFPEQPAIYFAIDSQDCIQYIGRSLNPKARWLVHHRYNQLEAIGSIRIAYLFIDTPELLSEIEAALITWFNPPLNVCGKPSEKCEPHKKNSATAIRKLPNLKRRSLKQKTLAARPEERLTAETYLAKVKALAIAKWGEADWMAKLVRAYAKLDNATPVNRRSQIGRAFEVGNCNLDTALLLMECVGYRLKIERVIIETEDF